jgi:glycosyltransferase involved in cell wall biosynthesis
VRIGVDATSWVNPRGYGRFTRNAVGRLVEVDPDTAYVLYIDEPSAAGAELPPGAETRRIPVSEAQWRATAGSRRSIRDLVRMAGAVRGANLDAFLFPSSFGYFPGVGAPTVVGIHDLIADTFPGLTLPTRRARGLWRLKEGMAVRRARRLFTVSEASRDLVASRFGIERDQLAVVPEAPDPVFSARGHEQTSAALRGLGVDPSAPYLLYAGGISPHKGVETLIDAYGLLGSRAERPRLILVGELDRDPYHSAGPAVRRRIADRDLQDEVLLTGFVSDETLACLYSGAAAVAIPSLAEGFGLPAVEAAACGAPTVLSDIAAHRETLGDAALYFEPAEPGELASRLEEILDDQAFRVSLGERARRAVQRLTWDASAERLGELIREAIGDSRSGGR